jgi:hypothetical protein
MKHSITEFTIIESLRQKSPHANPTGTFKKELQMLLEENKRTTHEAHAIKTPSQNRNLAVIGMFSFCLLIALGVIFNAIYTAQKATPNITSGGQSISMIAPTTDKTFDSSTEANSLSLGLQTEKLKSLTEAQAKVPYKIKVPSIVLANEKISEIKVSVANPNSPISQGNDLYITYSQDTTPLYRLTQSTFKGNKPEDGEKVIVNGVSGIYYKIPGIDSTDIITPDNEIIPRSYIVWDEGEIEYTISEVGQLSKEQLLKLANSLKEYK